MSKKSDTPENFDDVPAWLHPGREVARVTHSRSRGVSVVTVTAVRATATQVVMDDDTRIRKSWVGSGRARVPNRDTWSTDMVDLYPPDSEKVTEALAQAKVDQAERRLRNAAAAVHLDNTPQMVQTLRDACDAYLASVK